MPFGDPKEIVMVEQKRVGIGLIGAGFLAETRARCCAQTSGYNIAYVYARHL